MKKQRIENSPWFSLQEGEVIQDISSHPTILAYLLPISFGLIVAVAGLITPFLFDFIPIEAGLIVVALGVGLAIIEYLKHITRFYIVTNYRVFRKIGIINHKTRSVGHQSVDKAKLYHSIIGRIFGFGDVTIVTATPTDKDIKFKFIPNPEEVKQKIEQYNRENTYQHNIQKQMNQSEQQHNENRQQNQQNNNTEK